MSSTTPNRAGRSAGPFGPHPAAPTLARIPLLPAEPAEHGDGSALVAEGMFLASRQLADLPDTARSQHTRRAYDLRARHRPTPHGVFAGVALADVAGAAPALRVGAAHRVRTGPSGTWLAAVEALLLDGPDAPAVLEGLRLTANGTAMRRGDRWECETQNADGAGAIHRRTVRATAATNLIMAECADGASIQDIIKALASVWPHVPAATVKETVAEMVRHGFLLTDLLPTDTGNDPLGHLLAALPDTHPQRLPLARLRGLLAAADTHRPGTPERKDALNAARQAADQICQVKRPFVADVAADAHIRVPASLIEEVIEAAGILWRTAARHDPAADYHQRFADRYGHHRYVPLLQAADPVTGIGADISHDTAAATDPKRIAVLTNLIARAATAGSLEVELDEAAITALQGNATDPPPRSAEAYVRLVADRDRTTELVNLRPILAGGVITAGSTLARFASLLNHRHRDPDPVDAVLAELAPRPRSASAHPLAPQAGFAPYRIPVGVPAGGKHDLSLEDLLLVSDGNRLIVWSAQLDRQVIPVLYSRLSPALLPPIARLLHVVGREDATPYLTWSWGPLAASAFQPRIRYRRTILALARWSLPPALTAAASNRDRWDAELDAWRTCHVPKLQPVVVTDDDDRLLPLDIEQDADRELLRRYVRRGLTAVTETPGGEAATGAIAPGPNGNHLVELVVPMLRRADPVPPRHRAILPARRVGDGLFHPGGRWLSLAIPTAAHLQDQLLQRLDQVAQEHAEHWESWFWLRYRTPVLGHHLRVRFHGRPELLGAHVLPAVAVWAQRMNRENLAGRMVVECYDQEIERYGGPEAIEYAEAVFAADSRLVLAGLSRDDDTRITAAAHVAATIAATVAAGAPLSALDRRRLDRAARADLTRLRPIARTAETEKDGSGPTDPELFAALRERLTAYRGAIPLHLRSACASSLIHMHANRALPGSGHEPLMRALAADLIARTR